MGKRLSGDRKRKSTLLKFSAETGVNATVENVVAEALELPLPLRAFVVEKLIESLDAPDSSPLSIKWREEIRRRCSELDRGAVELRHAENVFAEAFAALA